MMTTAAVLLLSLSSPLEALRTVQLDGLAAETDLKHTQLTCQAIA